MWEKVNLITEFTSKNLGKAFYYDESFIEKDKLYCFYNRYDNSNYDFCIPEMIVYNIPNLNCQDNISFTEYKNKFISCSDSIKITINKACWFGTKFMYNSQHYSYSLKNLYEYANLHSNMISVNNIVSEINCQNDISVFDFSIQKMLSNKYFIYLHGDIPSGILKWLLFSKRVVFIVEPTNVEYLYKNLIPYKHFIPIKNDLSNLIDEITFLEKQPDKYKDISNSAFDYISKMYSEENIISIFKKKIIYNKHSIYKNYLTFDDGPHPIYTTQLLDILKKNKAKSTFFILGENAVNYPNIIKRLHDEGHTIGIHGWNHDNIITKNNNEFIEEINKSINVIRDITGFSPILYRPPYGEIDHIKSKIINSHFNMKIIMGNIDSSDYNPDSTSTSITKYVLSQINSNDIIVFHDIFDKTIKSIDMLLSQGKNIYYDKL